MTALDASSSPPAGASSKLLNMPPGRRTAASPTTPLHEAAASPREAASSPGPLGRRRVGPHPSVSSDRCSSPSGGRRHIGPSCTQESPASAGTCSPPICGSRRHVGPVCTTESTTTHQRYGTPNLEARRHVGPACTEQSASTTEPLGRRLLGSPSPRVESPVRRATGCCSPNRQGLATSQSHQSLRPIRGAGQKVPDCLPRQMCWEEGDCVRALSPPPSRKARDALLLTSVSNSVHSLSESRGSQTRATACDPIFNTSRATARCCAADLRSFLKSDVSSATERKGTSTRSRLTESRSHQARGDTGAHSPPRDGIRQAQAQDFKIGLAAPVGQTYAAQIGEEKRRGRDASLSPYTCTRQLVHPPDHIAVYPPILAGGSAVTAASSAQLTSSSRHSSSTARFLAPAALLAAASPAPSTSELQVALRRLEAVVSARRRLEAAVSAR